MKTNAARLLDQLGIGYELREYESDEHTIGAEHVAQKVGLPLEQVFKTLVVRGDRTGVILAVVPGSEEVDLKKLAAASGNKSVEMVNQKEITPLTGYVRGGVSPLATKKKYPVYIDEIAQAWDIISVSAGLRGAQLLLGPDDLRAATGGSFAEIV